MNKLKNRHMNIQKRIREQTENRLVNRMNQIRKHAQKLGNMATNRLKQNHP